MMIIVIIIIMSVIVFRSYYELVIVDHSEDIFTLEAINMKQRRARADLGSYRSVGLYQVAITISRLFPGRAEKLTFDSIPIFFLIYLR